MVYPYLIYCNLIWGNTYHTRIDCLHKIQKKILRIITFSNYYQHSNELFKNQEILTIYKINTYLTSQFMYKYINNMLPSNIFSNYFKTNNEIHEHYTRSSCKLHIDFTRTNYKKFSLKHYGVNTWNIIDNNIKNSITFSSFKRKMKVWLVNS